MSSKFGWCLSEDHNACIVVTVTDQFACSCECHVTAGAGGRVKPATPPAPTGQEETTTLF